MFLCVLWFFKPDLRFEVKVKILAILFDLVYETDNLDDDIDIKEEEIYKIQDPLGINKVFFWCIFFFS